MRSLPAGRQPAGDGGGRSPGSQERRGRQEREGQGLAGDRQVPGAEQDERGLVHRAHVRSELAGIDSPLRGSLPRADQRDRWPALSRCPRGPADAPVSPVPGTGDPAGPASYGCAVATALDIGVPHPSGHLESAAPGARHISCARHTRHRTIWADYLTGPSRLDLEPAPWHIVRSHARGSRRGDRDADAAPADVLRTRPALDCTGR